MNPAIANWISVVTAALVIAAAIAIVRILNGKSNKVDVDKEFEDLRRDNRVKFEGLRADNKSEAEESLRQYRELQISVEQLKDRVVALDKNSLTKGDLVEMKGDIKDLVRGNVETAKLIDGMPDRLLSLEATRNKQSEH